VPQAPEDVELALPSYSGSGYGYSDADREILHMLTQKRHAKLGVRDWKYENRRAAQSILSFLYLGPSAAARDVDYLRQEGITMLLVIRDTKTAMARLLSGDKAAAALGIESAAVDVAGSQELIAAFPKAIKIINEHLIRVYKQTIANGAIPNKSNRGRVMVFCESGNERSAAVLAAYIMATYGTDLVAAIQYVQSQRFCVAFDDGLKNLLLNYQDLLYAQKSVIASYLTPEQCGPSMPAKIKRRREDTEDDDEDFDMDRADDQERFGERSSFVPFRDGGDAFSLGH
jgi:serine/threonine/tyrosine-interacting protein